MAIAVGLGLGALGDRQPADLPARAFILIIAAAVAASIWELRDTLAQARGDHHQPGSRSPSDPSPPSRWPGPTGRPRRASALALTALACMVWRFGKGAAGYLADVSASIFVAVYLGLFASFATLMLAPHDGAARILTFLIMVVCSDTGGYAAGVLFGKHPMAPTISPKKSWEGFAGSVLGADDRRRAVGLAAAGGQWWQGLIVGAAIASPPPVGDLAESLIKRDLGVKDMGTLLPGHGGVMDRMDSLLPSAVVTWALLAAVRPGRLTAAGGRDRRAAVRHVRWQDRRVTPPLVLLHAFPLDSRMFDPVRARAGRAGPAAHPGPARIRRRARAG